MPHSSTQSLDDLARSLSVDSDHSVIPLETPTLLLASFSPEILHQVRVAISFYNKAKENFNLNRYAEVETDTTQALDALELNLPTVYSYLKEPILLLRGNARLYMFKYTEAELDYSIALLTLVWTERVRTLFFRAICRLKNEDFPAAEYDLNLVINSRYKSELLYEALLHRSHIYFHQKKYSQAAADALAVISSLKLSSTLQAQAKYYYLASNIENKIINEDTERGLSELIEGNILPPPLLATAYYYRGDLRRLKQGYEQAKNDFAKALSYPLLDDEFKVKARFGLCWISMLETINSTVIKPVISSASGVILGTEQLGARSSAFKRLK